MKRLIPSLFLLAAFSFTVGEFTGCKGTPPHHLNKMRLRSGTIHTGIYTPRSYLA